MGLDISPAFALVILKSAPHGTEGIAQCDVGVFMRLIGRMRPPDSNLPIRHCEVDMKIEQRALMVPSMRRLDDDVATQDLLAELFEFSCELANAGFKRGRRCHLAEGNLQRQLRHVPKICTAGRDAHA